MASDDESDVFQKNCRRFEKSAVSGVFSWRRQAREKKYPTADKIPRKVILHHRDDKHTNTHLDRRGILVLKRENDQDCGVALGRMS